MGQGKSYLILLGGFASSRLSLPPLTAIPTQTNEPLAGYGGGVLFICKRTWGDERDIEDVGWDMSSPLELFLALGGNGSLFPQTSAWYLSSVDLGILKWRSAWKYVSSVEAAKEPQPLWNKNARGHEGISMFVLRELEPKKTAMKTRKNLIAFIC